MASEAPQRIGDYEILAPLGAGGMGRVYKVRNVISNREEAMKVLLPDFASDPELAARFMAEIRTLAGLEHPGIAQLRTAFQFQNQFVMVMEYVEGTTLEKLASMTRIPIDHMLDFSTQALAALSYAHSRGVTHRDIKPPNIMITSHGLVKLMDFGIAKSTNDLQLTRPGTTMGSVYYMSPEQVRGANIDARSDVYSFGVTLYEMFTGQKPFQADTSYSVLNAQLNDPPVPLISVNPDLPLELNNIVLRAMAKRPEDRFQSADEFRSALKALREQMSAKPAAQPAPQPSKQGAPAAFQSFQPGAPTVFESVPQGVPAAPQPFSQGAPTASQPFQQAAPAVAQTLKPAAASAPQAFQPVAQSASQAAPTVFESAYQPPPFTPVVQPPPPPPAARNAGNGHRGLWIGLGAATAILALIAVAAVLPRVFSTHANPKSPAATTETQPAANPPATPTATPQGTSPAGSPQPSGPPATPAAAASQKPSAGAVKAGASAGVSLRPAYQPPAAVAPAQPPAPIPANAQPATSAGPSPQEVREARDRMINLSARADAASSGVQQIRSQQQAQGFDMRGDILAAMNRMHSFMNEANRALDKKDLPTANEYMDRADHEITTLEKFLGR